MDVRHVRAYLCSGLGLYLENLPGNDGIGAGGSWGTVEGWMGSEGEPAKVTGSIDCKTDRLLVYKTRGLLKFCKRYRMGNVGLMQQRQLVRPRSLCSETDFSPIQSKNCSTSICGRQQVRRSDQPTQCQSILLLLSTAIALHLLDSIPSWSLSVL